jgi:hypothetical protein
MKTRSLMFRDSITHTLLAHYRRAPDRRLQSIQRRPHRIDIPLALLCPLDALAAHREGFFQDRLCPFVLDGAQSKALQVPYRPVTWAAIGSACNDRLIAWLPGADMCHASF